MLPRRTRSDSPPMWEKMRRDDSPSTGLVLSFAQCPWLLHTTEIVLCWQITFLTLSSLELRQVTMHSNAKKWINQCLRNKYVPLATTNENRRVALIHWEATIAIHTLLFVLSCQKALLVSWSSVFVVRWAQSNSPWNRCISLWMRSIHCYNVSCVKVISSIRIPFENVCMPSVVLVSLFISSNSLRHTTNVPSVRLDFNRAWIYRNVWLQTDSWAISFAHFYLCWMSMKWPMRRRSTTTDPSPYRKICSSNCVSHHNWLPCVTWIHKAELDCVLRKRNRHFVHRADNHRRPLPFRSNCVANSSIPLCQRTSTQRNISVSVAISSSAISARTLKASVKWTNLIVFTCSSTIPAWAITLRYYW